MAWSRLVPGFSRHIKRIKSGPLASWLWVCSVDYCTEFATDGFLDEQAIPSLCPQIRGAALKRCIGELVAVRSWVETAGGYIVYGYLEHNLSAEQVEHEREANRQRYQVWRDKRRSNGGTNAVGNGVTASPQGLSVGLSVSPQHPPTPQEVNGGRARGPRLKRHAAALGWSSVRAGLKAGAREVPPFNDPHVAPVLERMGGWAELLPCIQRDAHPSALASKRREFVELYEAMA